MPEFYASLPNAFGRGGNRSVLFFFLFPIDCPRHAARRSSIFITLDVRISISRRCTTGRRGNKFLRGYRWLCDT